MTLIGVICGIVALVIRGFITWFSEIKLKQMLKEKNYEMEMALIKSQLDPHRNEKFVVNFVVLRGLCDPALIMKGHDPRLLQN